MALGMMIPGMASGFIQEALGYPGFFVWIVIAAFPGILMVRYVKFPYEYGKKRREEEGRL
jgi:MFS transporter, PAT family, beta-lactamase induction signal transducer AmpG